MHQTTVPGAQTNGRLESFEVAKGDVFGDLLSHKPDVQRRPRIGLVASGFFEYWRMYPNLRDQVVRDAAVVSSRLAGSNEVVDAGIVDTVDAADAAGRQLQQAGVDVIVLAYRTYIPDAYVHQLLSRLAGVPILMFASQSRDQFDHSDNYFGVLRNSGVMALVQLTCGIRRMGLRDCSIECVAGSIHDDDAYKRLNQAIQVIALHQRLCAMTFGVIGQVFRGMYDFEYDKTAVKAALGPEVINLQIDHLVTAFDHLKVDDAEVSELLGALNSSYRVDGIPWPEMENQARAAIALRRVVERFRLDGLALLGQHLVERKLRTTTYLGMCELQRSGFACVTEGDVIGLIMMKILQFLSGRVPFFVEWSEFDVTANAWMLLGHGYADPTQLRDPRPSLRPAAEQWGLEGAGCSLAGLAAPGPCTLAHFAQHTDGWKLFLSGGKFADREPLPIDEVHAIVEVEHPIRDYVEFLVKAGVPHHAIAVRGDVRAQLRQFAAMRGMDVISI